jgi:hypothetical protein
MGYSMQRPDAQGPTDLPLGVQPLTRPFRVLLAIAILAAVCAACRNPAPTPTAAPALATEQILARAQPPARDPVQVARRLGKTVPDATPQPHQYHVGDRATFWVSDTLLNTYRQATATLQFATPDLYMWVEDGFAVPAEGVEASARRFAETTLPTLRALFGDETTTGADGNRPLHVFNGLVPNTGAYFFSQDEYPRAVAPRSNEKDVIFVNLQAAIPGTEGYDALLAHEFQHMLHWRSDPDEETWVNEGLSQLATRLAGLPVDSYAAYASATDIPLTYWPPRTANAGPHYGGTYLLMEYLLHRYGEGLIRDLAREPANGLDGLERALGRRGADFASLFRDWTVANLRGDYGPSPLPTPPAQAVAALPAVIADAVSPFGVDYISVPPAGTVRVKFAGQASVGLSPLPASDGDHLWWSNRGDNKDTTLTRAIDLTGVTAATLRVSMAYALEENWDFALALVSTDGGATWQPLAGAHTRPIAPETGLVGPGYTGNSGGGATPEWVDETYSLTPFAGRKVLLRFECLTDDAINLDGLWLRALEIPEIRWRDEGETDDGWEARGFVRVENRIAVRYQVTAVLHGDPPRVVPIEVASDGTAQATLHAARGLTLIVASLTPYTSEAATYTLRVEQPPSE